MLQVLILLTLVRGLLVELLCPLLHGRDGPAKVRAVPACLVEGCLQVTRLLDLDGVGALCFPKALSVLLQLKFLLTHVALHAHDLLLHAPVVLVYLLHPVSLHP
jgi:hypothetical protein